VNTPIGQVKGKEMIEIDGAKKSGSGTILRLSVALSAILGEPLHIFNIRKKRSQPGLRPQHLEAVLTAARLCNADVKGAYIGSQELWFYPGRIEGGNVEAEIGTAGSIPMLIMTVLPICAFAKRPVHLHVLKGGTDVSHSPTINYLKHVFLPVLKRMGLEASIEVHKYGYYPRGGGEVTLNTQPCPHLKPLILEEFGDIQEVRGVSICTYLADRGVARRQAREAERLLRARGYDPKIEVINDFSNPIQKGSSLVLWIKTDTDVMLGSDSIGEIRKPSEIVAREAVKSLLDEIRVKPTVDIHLADMLIPYIALADGESIYLARMITDHMESNMWLVEEILGVSLNVERRDELIALAKK